MHMLAINKLFLVGCWIKKKVEIYLCAQLSYYANWRISVMEKYICSEYIALLHLLLEIGV